METEAMWNPFPAEEVFGGQLRGIAPGASRGSRVDNAGLWALLPTCRIQVFSDLPQASGRSIGPLHFFSA